MIYFGAYIYKGLHDTKYIVLNKAHPTMAFLLVLKFLTYIYETLSKYFKTFLRSFHFLANPNQKNDTRFVYVARV